MVHVHNGAIKRNEIIPFTATWMDLDSVILSEVRQTEKEKLSYDISCKWNLKRNGTNEFIYKTERESQA